MTFGIYDNHGTTHFIDAGYFETDEKFVLFYSEGALVAMFTEPTAVWCIDAQVARP